MRFRTHLAFSFLISILIIDSFNIQNKIIFIVVLLIASALPDIDSYKSKLGKKIKPISFLINILLGHRGIFHSPFLLILISMVIAIINIEIAAAFFIGYLSHLVLENIFFILLLVLCFYMVI